MKGNPGLPGGHAIPTRSWLVAVFLGLLASLAPARADDWDYWNQQVVEGPKLGRWTPWFYADTRTGLETGRTTGYVLSPRVRYQLADGLNAEAHYSWVSTRNSRGEFIDQHRAEFELNPNWRLGTNLLVVLRNRVEVRWIENQTGVSPRTRHRLHVEYALHGMGPLTSVFFQNEAIFEYDGFRLSEDRLVPLGLGFRLGSHANLRVYYCWRPLHLQSGWHDTQFVATQVTWKF